MDLVSIVVVALVTFVAIFAGTYAYGMTHLREIKENWVSYRCNPVYMPLAGMVGSDILSNFTHCVMQSTQSYAGFVMDPVFQLFGQYQELFSSILTSMQFIRKKMAGTTDAFLSIGSSIYGKLANTMGAVLQLVGRLRTILNRILSVFIVMLHIARTGVDSGMSIKNGPIGQTADFLCFDPSTPVRLADGRTLPIGHIEVGMTLENGEYVTSTMVFDGRGTAMVDIGGICVSANHKILTARGWIRCGDHPDAMSIAPHPYIVCLNTIGHTIPIHGMLFKDYEETDDTAEFDREVAAYYKSPVPPLRQYFRQSGFHYTTKIRMQDGSVTPIHEIRIGDQLWKGGKVLGIFKHQLTVPLARAGVDVLAAPGTLWLKDGRLRTVAGVEYDSTLPPDAAPTCMNLLTDTALVTVVDGHGHDLVFLDDQEVPDTHIHERRDQKVLDG